MMVHAETTSGRKTLITLMLHTSRYTLFKKKPFGFTFYKTVYRELSQAIFIVLYRTLTSQMASSLLLCQHLQFSSH